MQLVLAKLHQYTQTCGNQKGSKLTTRIIERREKGVDILDTFGDKDGSAHYNHGPYFGKTSDMIERTADDKRYILVKTLSTYQILGIGQDGSMAQHHSLLVSGSACGEQDIGNVVGDGISGNHRLDLGETDFRNVFSKGTIALSAM